MSHRRSRRFALQSWPAAFTAVVVGCAAVTGVRGPEYRPTTTANHIAYAAKKDGGKFYSAEQVWLNGSLRVEVGNSLTGTSGIFDATNSYAGIGMLVEVHNNTQDVVRPSLFDMVLIDDQGRTWTAKGIKSTDGAASNYNFDVHPGTTRSWEVGFSRQYATLNDLPAGFRVRLRAYTGRLGIVDGEFRFERILKP